MRCTKKKKLNNNNKPTRKSPEIEKEKLCTENNYDAMSALLITMV